MGPGAPPTHKLVRIEVETSVDIHRIATESELNIWMEVWNCRTGASLFGYDGILYYKDVRVNYMNTSSLIQGLYAKASRGRKQGEPFLYDFYIEPESDLDQPRGPGQPDLRRPYNLEEAPFAICFHLGGGNMMGGYFVSNTVVVPADDIAKAIDRPGV